MTSVHTAENEVEAVMLRGILEEAGIPVVLRARPRSPYLEALNPAELYQPGLDWRELRDLLVPDDRTAEAKELIAGYLASLRDGGA